MHDHPDDDTDDTETLKENLRQLRKALAREKQDSARLAAETQERLEEANDYLERREEVTNWFWEDDCNNLWDEHDELLERHSKLVADWNRALPRINAGRPSPGRGRPLAASEAQVDRVHALRVQGRSYDAIVAMTGLSKQTVRTILTATDQRKRKARQAARRESVRDAVRRHRERTRQREALRGKLDELRARIATTLKVAKGLA